MDLAVPKKAVKFNQSLTLPPYEDLNKSQYNIYFFIAKK